MGRLHRPAIAGLVWQASLGRGRFGRVFGARRAEDGAEVAVKVLERPFDPRFDREVAALRQVGAPAAPRFVDAGRDGNAPWLAMEWVRGETLAQQLARHTDPIDLRQVARRFRRLCDAVARVHDAGFVHRDLKPEHVVFRAGGQVCLLDFGLARSSAAGGGDASDAVTAATQRPGTVAYMAPERLAGDVAPDPRADVYALGVMLFQMLCGRLPFGEGASAAVRATSEPLPRPSHVAACPVGVDAVVRRCTAKDPDRRYPDARAVVAAASAALRDRGPSMRRAGFARGTDAPPASPARPRLVALLGIRGGASVRQVADLAVPHGGTVVRCDAVGVVLAFDAPRSMDGVRAALRMAQRVGPLRCQRVVHVAPLRVKATRRGTRYAGRAIASADAWMTLAAAADVVATPAAARYVDRVARRFADGSAELALARCAASTTCARDRGAALTTVMRRTRAAREGADDRR